MSRCPSCSSEVTAGSRFCASCGASLSAPGVREETAPGSSGVARQGRVSHGGRSGRDDQVPGTSSADQPPITRTSLPDEPSGGTSAAGVSYSARPGSRVSPSSSWTPGSSGGEQARFLPGAMVAGRYRVIGLIGRGGMGEVYRADDLKLGRPVALKFLSEELQRDPGRLNRFLNEARVALEVSHPNVCRVHDIGEVDGHHYITMEYVDGEDLSSLLRRIGRFPSDRAIQAARQLCAGLAAAHEKGILHRDLKPSNVMIDGRGQVRITDFGLAGLESELRAGVDIRAGTPAYMSPEQLAGKEVTVQSDIYSLGLVLYELFTGKPVFKGRTPAEISRLHAESTPTNPSSLIEGMDPAVERVILRCLEEDPADRPSSALAVSSALPGGDPLAAALAAGEIPSPELVAHAGQTGGLAPRTAMICLAGFLVGVAALVWLAGRTLIVTMVDLPKPPAVLVERSKEIIRSLGYEEPPADSIYGFDANYEFIRHLEGLPADTGRIEEVRTSRPSILDFRYRESPASLVRISAGSIGNWMNDPPADRPGMIEVGVDPLGRLFEFTAVPPDHVDPSGPNAGDTPPTETVVPPEPDWSALFSAADLDQASFTPVEPLWTPPNYADTRAAWEGHYPGPDAVLLRIEAAAWHGRPVWFRTVDPWTQPGTDAGEDQGFWAQAAKLLMSAWYLIVVIGAAIFAWRNLRRGRGDRQAAFRLALYLGGMRLLWLVGAHHVADQAEIDTIVGHLAWSLYRVGLAWLFYLAIEPYARRYWPRVMVSWVRLLNGRFRDPLVGRDLLIGALFGVVFALSIRLAQWVPARFGLLPATVDMSLWAFEALRGPLHVIAAIAGVHVQSVLSMFIPIMLLVMLRLILRRTWASVAIVTGMATVIFNPGGSSPWPYLVSMAIIMTVFWIVLFRAGFLAVLFGATISDLLRQMPLTFDVTSWYAGASLVTLLVVVGLTLFAFRVSLAGRPLFGEDAVEAGAPARG